MKKEITTLLMALCFVGATSAQQRQAKMGADSESKLLSTTQEGNYTVRRYLVKETSPDNNEFSVRYKINVTQLISSYDNNANELKGLDSFIKDIQSDTLKHISAINIVGCASPDGPHALNEKLAAERAKDFRQYINKNYDMAQYSGSTTSDAQRWSATAEAISNSSVPNKSAVLALVKSSQSDAIIESKLKEMPDSWDYIKSNILPPMRSVELWVKYNSWKIEEQRTLNKNKGQAQAQKRRGNSGGDVVSTTYFFIVSDEPEGMIVNPTSAPLDYDNAKFKEKYKVNRRRAKLKEMMRN